MLDEATVEQFKTGLRGELIQPGDPGYDEARKVQTVSGRGILGSSYPE
jgi:hypothetical protein